MRRCHRPAGDRPSIWSTSGFCIISNYALYLDLFAQATERARVEMWAYCLIPNHVHVILVPADADGLRATMGKLHWRYTGFINARRRCTGHLWQGRFGSVAMDEAHLVAALRYVRLTPVRARLVTCAADWPWSSARAHLAAVDDHVVRVRPSLERVCGLPRSWTRTRTMLRRPRCAETIGRPIGDTDWIKRLEEQTGRRLIPAKRGPKRQGEVVVK